jgi:hypothetical protein
MEPSRANARATLLVLYIFRVNLGRRNTQNEDALFLEKEVVEPNSQIKKSKGKPATVDRGGSGYKRRRNTERKIDAAEN